MFVLAAFSDSDGARNPREAAARSSRASNGCQRRLTLGENASPKSL